MRLTGNRFVQKMLLRQARTVLHWAGIGGGANVAHSGEKIALKRLANHPFPCIFDVGAHTGEFALMAVEQLPNAQIFSFEPSATTYRELVQNVERIEQIETVNLALGRKSERRTLYADMAGSGLASMTKRDVAHYNIQFEYQEQIDVSTVDEFCDEWGIGRIDLLKLDVEGHELDVLTGARTMFERNAIELVTFEFGGCNIDTRTFLRDFFNFFAEYEMMIARITPSGYAYSLADYSEHHEQFLTTNFIAYQNSAV